MTDSITEKDKKDWEAFILNKDKLPNKDQKLIKYKNLKTGYIDLHGYSLQQANKTIKDFIIKSYEEKISKLIVVTGKVFTLKMKKIPTFQKN